MNVLEALDEAEVSTPIIAAIFIGNDGYFRTWLHGQVATEQQLGYIVEGLVAGTRAIGTTGVAGEA